MDEELMPQRLRIFLEGDVGETEVDLYKVSSSEFFKNDVIRYRLTGTIPIGPDFKIVNFVGCTFDAVTAEGIDFSECDFKDTLLREVRFSDCSFNGATFATSFFSDAEFNNCIFYNLAVHNCEFHKVTFIGCNLTNLLVKSSRFSESLFQNCVTSNKICEMSTLFNVSFEGTPIQIETITNNFGLKSNNISGSIIRSGRARESHRSLDFEELGRLVNSLDLSVLERLSLEYFLRHTFLNGSILLDQSLDITQWTRIYRNPGSFVELLDKFAEFLVYAYDEGKSTIHPILLLHHVTGSLVNSISPGEKLHSVAVSLGGIHLILSRIVEDFLRVLELISQRIGTTVSFLVDGPADLGYFEIILDPWIKSDDLLISKLERNSPLTMELTAAKVVSLIPFIAAFLATRAKIEITRLKNDLEKAAEPKGERHLSRSKSSKVSPEQSQETPRSILSISSGWESTSKTSYELRVQSLMPGSLLLDLRLNFSTTLAQRLRSIVLLLLTNPTTKGD